MLLIGGQKARIALARAVYRDADVYLLDDPLSAVDSHVALHLYEQCILRLCFTYNKCIVLATNSLNLIKNASCICVLEKGYIIESGNYNTLLQVIYVFI